MEVYPFFATITSMVTRRKFLGSLAGLTAITALAGAGLRVPPRKEVEVELDISPYLASKDAWYLKIETVGLKHFYRNTAGSDVQLSEKSLEAMLFELQTYGQAFYKITPRKLIVPPHLAKRAKEIIEHRPGGDETSVMWWSVDGDKITAWEPDFDAGEMTMPAGFISLFPYPAEVLNRLIPFFQPELDYARSGAEFNEAFSPTGLTKIAQERMNRRLDAKRIRQRRYRRMMACRAAH